MAQKFILKFWLLWFLFSASSAFGASLSCVDIFAGKQRATTKIDTFVAQQLRANGFEISPRVKTSLALRFRSMRALRKLDFKLLANDRYRNDQVETFLDLQISRSLSPINDLELALHPVDRAAVRRLILRNVLEKGLLSLVEQDASSLTAFRKILNRVLSRPGVRVFTQFKLPLKTVELNDEQISSLLSGRTSRILGDANFRDVVNAQGRVTALRGLNRAAVMMVGAVLFAITYQQIGAEYDREKAKADAEKTAQFKKQASEETSVDTSELGLSLAKKEQQSVLKSFREKYHEEPTSDEMKQIRTEICTVRYGNVLNEKQTASCLTP